MTYCVGLKLDSGLVFMSDTRTNAGVDNVSKFKKMYTWEVPGDRAIVIMTAGNLATTQTTIGLLNERVKVPEDRSPSMLEVPTMFQIAQLVGRTLREVIAESAEDTVDASADFGASLIVGGQVGDADPTMFMVYPEGNFIEVSDDTPFLQIGEIKYGRPILVRTFDPSMSVNDAVALLLVSFDSTMRANLSVGMPFDVAIYESGAHGFSHRFRIDQDDLQYRSIASGWSAALRSAFAALEPFQLPD